jgi:hypothetical protein
LLLFTGNYQRLRASSPQKSSTLDRLARTGTAAYPTECRAARGLIDKSARNPEHMAASMREAVAHMVLNMT